MTTNTDVVNRALQVIGTRTTVTDGELTANSTNEAIQANLILTKYRDQLLRMAPWNCGLVYANLIYITSAPGSAQNTSPVTNLWTPGQPAPGWGYEYLYPDDCLKACFVIPSTQAGVGGVPITLAVTGNAGAYGYGPPSRFKVALDQYFRLATGAVTIVSGGSGHTAGDDVICGGAPDQGEVPAGLVNLNVTSVTGGVITAATLLNFTNLGKSSLLYAVPTYNLNQVASSGLGTGAIVSVAAVSPTAFQARTILTNQEYATLAYVKQVTDPNVMDDDFIEAWANILGASLCIPLSGDKQLAKMAIEVANRKIAAARQTDGNEGLTINDVTPDWIRVRGYSGVDPAAGPWSGFDWGGLWPSP